MSFALGPRPSRVLFNLNMSFPCKNHVFFSLATAKLIGDKFYNRYSRGEQVHLKSAPIYWRTEFCFMIRLCEANKKKSAKSELSSVRLAYSGSVLRWFVVPIDWRSFYCILDAQVFPVILVVPAFQSYWLSGRSSLFPVVAVTVFNINLKRRNRLINLPRIAYCQRNRLLISSY